MPAKTFQLGKEYIIFLKRKHASLTIKVFDGRHPIIIRSAAIWLVCVFSAAFFCIQAPILGLHNWRPAGWLPCKWPDFGSVSKKINTLSLPLWILLINFTFTFTYAASYFVHSYFFCLYYFFLLLRNGNFAVPIALIDFELILVFVNYALATMTYIQPSGDNKIINKFKMIKTSRNL